MSLDVPGVLLCSILNDPEKGMEVWPKLKLVFFSSSYSTIYNAIGRFYEQYHRIPCFTELKTLVRDPLLQHTIAALELLQIDEDFDLIFLLDALVNEYTQNEALTKLDLFADKLTMLDSEEIKEELANIVLYLEEKTFLSEEIYTMDTFILFDEVELRSKIPLGISNYFDALTGGVVPTELIYIGGERGSGKTVVATNISARQYEQGNVSLFFTIEMRAREIFTRHISCIADVDHTRLRNGNPTEDELRKIAKVRADMFVDAEELYQDYITNNEYNTFERNLLSSKTLIPDNQIVIVDNSRLNLADIDLGIQKYKARFGEKLKIVVIDYVNQIDIKDIYDWKSQIYLSKSLKGLARKHEVVIVSPYQIDKTGEARFSKGILDAADISLIISTTQDTIDFKTTKTRNMPAAHFSSYINWDSMRLDPADVVVPEKDSEEEKDDNLPF